MNRNMMALLASFVTLTAATVDVASAGAILDGIRQRGQIRCGVMNPLPAWNYADAKGEWQGFNADVCRALAVAVFNDPSKAQITTTTPAVRLTALQTGELDVLVANVTETLTRDTELGLTFAPVIFYDGQGIMVRKDLNVNSAKELDGATVCVSPGTTTELNLADYFRSNGLKFQTVVIENQAETRRAFTEGRCDALTDDRTTLASQRLALNDPENYIVLPEALSKEPLAPVTRQGDDQWADIVRWTIYSLIEAEELDIRKDNVEAVAEKSADPRVQRFLGVTPGLGKALGLDEKWAANVIKNVGNYGELYDQHLGEKSPMKLPRAANDLWSKGGQLYSRAFR
ncbi:amino acid ABC transporter substrate-binding protein [Brucella pseudogrignonensis]|uniref:amino acid ABC transporter substrate-binding protein n=1 Tax=Brucella pseudogrignonensis TaxID=419475 RepID=UPI003D9656CC